MIFFLTLQAYRNRSNNLKYMDDVVKRFDTRVSNGSIRVSDVKEHAWSIDEKVVKQQEDLFDLSISCKTVVYIMMFGDECCFDVNMCSFMAINFLFMNCYYREIGIIINTPYLINDFVSPNYFMEIYFEGVYVSMKTETPFELFSVGVKDLCRQLAEEIKTPILLDTYEEILQINENIDDYAEKLELMANKNISNNSNHIDT